MTIVSLIDQSLCMLRDQAPPGYHRLMQQMAEMKLSLVVDQEHHGLRFSTFGHHFYQADNADVSLFCSRDSLINLIEGHTTLLESARRDDINIIGRKELLITFHDGLTYFVDQIVKLKDAPELLQQLKKTG